MVKLVKWILTGQRKHQTAVIWQCVKRSSLELQLSFGSASLSLNFPLHLTSPRLPPSPLKSILIIPLPVSFTCWGWPLLLSVPPILLCHRVLLCHLTPRLSSYHLFYYLKVPISDSALTSAAGVIPKVISRDLCGSVRPLRRDLRQIRDSLIWIIRYRHATDLTWLMLFICSESE